MLFYLDDHAYEQRDLDNRWAALESQSALASARRIAVCTHDRFEWLAMALYARRHGLSVAPLHPDTPLAAALDKAAQLECDTLIWQSSNNLHRLEPTEAPSGTLIQFSSGTTGEPKRIERTWEEIDTEIEHYNRALNLSPEVVPVVACSVTHSYGLICGVMASMARGAVPHIVTGWNPKHLLRTLRQYSKPMLYSSPSFIKTLLMLWPGDQPLYGVMTSGSVMPRAWFETLTKKTVNVWQQYGCSEAGCVAIARQPVDADVMGNPLGHCELQAGRDADAPDEVVIQLGERQVRTGDAGYLDANGALRFCGRLDDTIISAGLNVYPQEVEDALLTHSGIHDVVVFKLPDALAGERVAAVYTGDASLTDRELRSLYRERLATYQWPTWVRHLDRIPRMPNGKVSRRALAARFAAEGNNVMEESGESRQGVA
ncbi:AMP-binding protein [Marinimicrobium agarilyticum]|uniref:AMP-binding protein n=1 Tax=Marinimicrobium agarilyticum TaxID=306546 RepID=UPI0003FC3EB3|nr:AMP-binding protein [Marinimicrobium agarilyticum]